MRKRRREEPERQEEEKFFPPMPMGGGIEDYEEFLAEVERQAAKKKVERKAEVKVEGKEEKKTVWICSDDLSRRCLETPLKDIGKHQKFWNTFQECVNDCALTKVLPKVLPEKRFVSGEGYPMPRPLFSPHAKLTTTPPTKPTTRLLPLLKKYQASCVEEDIKKILNILAQHEDLEYVTELIKGILFDPFFCPEAMTASRPENRWALINKIEDSWISALVGISNISEYTIDWNNILRAFQPELETAAIFSPFAEEHFNDLLILLLHVLHHVRQLQRSQEAEELKHLKTLYPPVVAVDQQLFSETSPQLLVALASFLNQQLTVMSSQPRATPEGKVARKNLELFLELAVLPGFFYKILSPSTVGKIGADKNWEQIYLQHFSTVNGALSRFIKRQDLSEAQEKKFIETEDRLNDFVRHVENELAK